MLRRCDGYRYAVGVCPFAALCMQKSLSQPRSQRSDPVGLDVAEDVAGGVANQGDNNCYII